MVRKYWFILLITLTSCGADWHIKRAIQKDPTILKRNAIVNTVYDTMTVVTEGDRVDTIFHVQNTVDTFYIHSETVGGTVVYNTDTIFVDVYCEPDTILIPYEKEQTILQPEIDYDTWSEKLSKKVGGWVIVLLLILVIGWLVSRILRR